MKHLPNKYFSPIDIEHKASHKRDIILTQYIKSFLSNKKEMHIFDNLWNRWILLFKPKKINININNLSVDNLRNITSFLTLIGYAFGMLQINKYFHKVLSPKYSPNIMKDILLANWNRKIEYQPQPHLLPRYKDFWEANPKELLEEWEIIGTFAWQNTKRVQYDHMDQILAIIDQNRLKQKSYHSSRFLLNFLYKCRYGGISKTVELKELIYQLISNGGGLGFGYMITFYYFKFFGIIYINPNYNEKIKRILIKRAYKYRK